MNKDTSCKWLEKHLSIRGFNVNVSRDDSEPENIDINESNIEEDDVKKYFIGIDGFTGAGVRKCKLSLSLPKINSQGIYEMNGIKRAIVKRIRRDYSNVLSKQKSFVVDDWVKVLTSNLSRILSNSLENFYYHGIIPPENIAQDKIDRFLKTDYICQRIPDSKIAEISIPETIYFKNIVTNDFDVESRQFPDELAGLVDYASTGAGDNINKSYRLVKGTVIDKLNKNKLKVNERGNLFCSTIQNNAIGIQYNPNRIHLLRAQFEQALSVENFEIPYIRAKDNMLEGIHFNTAIMNFGYKTYEDAIAFSESAAARFKAIRKHYVRINTSNRINVKVAIGNNVSSTTAIIEEIDSEDKIRNYFCNKLNLNGKVVGIKTYNSVSYSRDTKKTVVEIEEIIPLMPGDKITTRGGIKGVAVISPDHKMPHLKVNNEFIPIDICISTKCVYNRRSVVTLWEMAANRYAIDNHMKSLISKPFEEPVSYKWLMENDYGDMTQLYIKGKELTNKTYVNPLFFMRNDKISSDILSYNGDSQDLTENGLPVGNSKKSGQRFDMANRENIRFKGLDNISASLSSQAKGRSHVMNLLNAINNKNK
jgi:hypothetical protein